MRLDKYLKVSRIIKRRVVAKEISNLDRIYINGKIAKPSTNVNIGDLIDIHFGNKIVKIKVTSIIDSTKIKDANLMYEFVDE